MATPTIPRRFTTIEGSRSGVTAADIRTPYRMLSDGLDSLGEGLDEAAVSMAEQAGSQAITRDADGNPQVEQYPIVGKAAMAYKRARKVSALADAEGEARRGAIELRQQFRDDPDGYIQAANAYRDEMVSRWSQAAGNEVGVALGRSIDGTVTQTWQGLLNEKERLDLARSTTSIETRIKQVENDAVALARSGDTASPEFRRLVTSAGDLRRELSANPRLAYPQERASYDDKRFASELKIAGLTSRITGKGGVLETQGYEAASKAAESVRTDRSLALSDTERYAAFNRIMGEVNQKRAAAQTGLRQNTAEMDSIEKLAADGLSVPPEQIAAVRSSVAAAGDKDLSDRLERTEAVVTFSQGARQMTPDELERTLGSLNTLMADSPPTTVLAVRNAGVKLLAQMRKQLAENPLAWSARVGLQPVAPIDLANPASMRARAAQAEAVASHYGMQPTYLLPGEAQALEAAAAKGGPDMLGAAQAIAEGFGDRAGRVSQEIAKQSPVFAHVGALMASGGSIGFLTDVAEAARLRTNPDFKPPKWLDKPSEKILAAQTGRGREAFGGAFVAAPDTQRAVEAAARDAYFTRAARAGYDPLIENGDSKTAFDRALQEAAGARFTADGVQYGGVGTSSAGWFSFGGRQAAKVLVPASVRADRFDEVIGAVTDADLAALPVKPQAVDGRVYSARDLRNATPVATRRGYRFAMGDPASTDPKWIRGADGQPFTLDLDALEPTLRKRVPGAYLGGR